MKMGGGGNAFKPICHNLQSNVQCLMHQIYVFMRVIIDKEGS